MNKFDLKINSEKVYLIIKYDILRPKYKFNFAWRSNNSSFKEGTLKSKVLSFILAQAVESSKK